MLQIFRRTQKEQKEVRQANPAPYPYLSSEYNQGILLGEYGDYQVRMDPFHQENINPHVGIIGSSGYGKTTLIKSMLRNEDRDMNRFIVTTRGYEFEDMENTSVTNNMIVNPFYIKSEPKEISNYIIDFFNRFGELKHTPFKPFEMFEESRLSEFIEGFLDKTSHEELYSISSLERELTAACHLFEEKADLQLRLISKAYQESKKSPYDFYVKHKEQFDFNEEIKTVEVYKKLLKYIAFMRKEGLLKYFEGLSNVYPLHRGITVINLMELEIEIYRYSKNTTFVTSVLLDYLHDMAIERSDKTAIYIDPLHEFMMKLDFFRKGLAYKLATGRKHHISYRISGISLDKIILQNCQNLIQMGRLNTVRDRRPFDSYPEVNYLGLGHGILVRQGRNTVHTLFKVVNPMIN